MDHKTNVSQLKEQVKKFCDERNWDQYHNAKDLAIGIITEASELLEHFRFKSEKEVELMFRDQNKKKELSEEMSDVFYFLLRLAQRYDIDLTTEFDNKMKKNEQKYPIDNVKGLNKKYTEYTQ